MQQETQRGAETATRNITIDELMLDADLCVTSSQAEALIETLELNFSSDCAGYDELMQDLKLKVETLEDDSPSLHAPGTAAPTPAATVPTAKAPLTLASVQALRADLFAKLAASTDADVLVTMLVPELDLATRGDDLKRVRADLKAAVQAKVKALGGSKPTAAEMRDMFPDVAKPTKGRAVSASLTHYGVAQRVVGDTDGDLRYNIDQEQWIQWDQRRWVPLRSAQVGAIARTTTNRVKAVLAMLPDADLDKLLVADSDSFRRGVLGEMVSAERLHIEQVDLNTHARFLAAGNGAIDLETADLVCNRDLFVTVRNDTEYDPGADCPTFLRVLREAFESRAEDLLYYRLVMGYTMQGNPTERAMFFHKGEGRNGKSLLLGAIQRALGDYAASVSYQVIADAPGSTFNSGANGPSPAVRRLMDKRLAYIDEVPMGSNLRDADVKLFAGGGGVITARGLGKEAVEFNATAVFHIACNNLPTVRGGQTATWSRVFPVAYTKQFNGAEDTTLSAKLEAERAGILAWLVSCAMEYRLMVEGGGKLRDFMPASAQAELAALQLEQNPFADWIADKCELADGAFMTAQEGWKSYVEYEAERNLDGARSVRSVKAFVQRMKEQKIGSHATQVGPNRMSGFYGIRVKGSKTTAPTPALF